MRYIDGGWMLWSLNLPSASNMGGLWERQIRSTIITLYSLLKTHNTSLNDEFLSNLLIEFEVIATLHPLTTDILIDVHSMIPLSPINLLTLKSRVVMLPPGVFTAPEICYHKHWRRVQLISNEFWRRWRKEVLKHFTADKNGTPLEENAK